MPEISTAKSPVQRTNAAPQKQKRDKLVGALFAGAKTLLISFAKTGYALWLQITGLLCALIAVRYGSALYQEYRANHFADRHRVWTFALFTTVFVWFTILSYVKARRMMKRK